MVLKVCGYYWINVSPIKEIIIRCLCTFKLTLRSLWRSVRLLCLLCLCISPVLNALATGGNEPSPADPLGPTMNPTWVPGRPCPGLVTTEHPVPRFPTSS